MGGLEFCGAIKKDPDFKGIPFILIANIFDEISERDRQRVRADGVISKPLNEDEVLNLVDHLMEKEVGKREEMVSGKGEFSLDEVGEGEEEIIELVDVVEEPEPKMSIDDLVARKRRNPWGRSVLLTPGKNLSLKKNHRNLNRSFVPKKRSRKQNSSGERKSL